MAVSVYDEQFLNDDQKKRLQAFTDEWNRANAAGDQNAMDAAHRAAEAVRAESNYSGGQEGSGYTSLGQQSQAGSQNGNTGYQSYSAYRLPSYQAQTDQVNALYDAARQAQLTQLKSAYDQNNATLEAQRAAIPEAYQAQRNATAAQSELAGRNFREYAAASGLNSGAGGQAELARSNQLQGDLSALGRQETAEQRDLESKIAQLKIQYQNDVSAAIAQGEYDRAAALLQEYQRAAESAVTTAQAQANENYRAWQSGYSQTRDTVSDNQWQQQFAEAQRQADQAQANWQAQFNYGQQQDAQSQANWQAQFDYGREQDTLQNQLNDYQQRLKEAQLWAGYGDFSKLRELGIDTTTLEQEWAAEHGTGAYGTASGTSSGGVLSGKELDASSSRNPLNLASPQGGNAQAQGSLLLSPTGDSPSGAQKKGSGGTGGDTVYTPSVQKPVSDQPATPEPNPAQAQYDARQAAAGQAAPARGASPVTDIVNGTLTVGSPAHTMYGLFMHTVMPYEEMLERLSAAVSSGQISEQAGQYIYDAIKPRG